MLTSNEASGSAPDAPAAEAIDRLRRSHPWPAERPAVPDAVETPGWLGAGSDLVLARDLSPETRLVVELGAWLGMSTRFIADRAPNATVVSVDHWQGSPEHHERPEFRAMLPALYETFLALCWDYRDRVIPLRMSTLDGLRTVAEHGLKPDLVYIDAEHSYDAVTAELELAHELFPDAILSGDDYDWGGVRDAVDGFARRRNLHVERFGDRGWTLLEIEEVPADGAPSASPLRAVVLVPHMGPIEPACEQGLRELEKLGIRVVRRQGSSQIDVARNELISEALHDGYEAILFIDSDIGFDPMDAVRLLERPEPVVAGVYAKKGPREVASAFADGVQQVVFGADAPGLYPLKYAATGFLRIRAEVLRWMIERLKLPLCNTRWGRGSWPFFQPVVVPDGEGRSHYLGEDWAFSHRLLQIGVTPMADTTFRLYHFGPYGYSWEEAGADRARFRSYSLQLG